ncbi:MAG: methyltransferase family protein [Anaerolineae bacterium]
MIVKLALFAIGSLGIVRFSWPWLRNPRAHGFYRFFAFELLLALFLLNAGDWFREPFSPRQLAAWTLLFASLALAIHGFYLLRVIGQPKGDFEQTTTLVTVGAYKYIRHPLYASLLLLDWGIFLKHVSLLTLVLAVLITAFLTATAAVEEAENAAKFGADYREYIKTSKRFIPFLF